jgi:GalNAc-alpha-(1->4)-GalNAc-alpha-(1->3)-diNAcBac-PP-undecaprenol alpha-1,4-N-acetyl-D-galactosaminyltransferase
MNVALVISSLSSGGAERVMSELASGWAARGDTVTLITVDGWESDSYALHPRVRRVVLGMLGESRGLRGAVANNYKRAKALRLALITAGAPVVLSFEARTSALVLLATAGTGLRRVVSERVNPSEHGIGLLWSVLRRFSYPFADALVVQTNVAVPWAQSVMLGRARVHVISNPIRDMRAFTAESERDRSHTVVGVGRLVPQKGFELLLRAFARISDDFPSWKLVIVGEGHDRRALEALAVSLGLASRVALPGWLGEPGQVLKAAGLFVMASYYEGFPNALVEAMACGVPVVSTDWAGATEIVTDGIDGLVVSKDCENLAAAMRRMLADAALRTRLGQNALAVNERYRLASVIGRWDTVLAAPCEQLTTLKSCS